MNKQITEDYVSFEIAKLLKEKGFDEPSRFWYDNKGVVSQKYIDATSNPLGKDMHYPCVTLSLAMKWLREVHNWYIDIRFNRHYQYYIPIVYNMSGTLESIANLEERSKQYEQAVEIALLYVLKNLI